MPHNPNILRSVRNGDYIFTQSIGKGEFGETFSGNDRRGRLIAGKFLLVDPPPTLPAHFRTLSVDEQLGYERIQNSYLTQQLQVEREFSREAATHARLNHPNIVKIRDFDVENGQPYIIMELATAALNRYLTTGKPLTVDEAADFVLQIGKGIQYAHDNEVIHRDLKPGNVLIFEDAGQKRLAVTDFGIYLPLHSIKSTPLQKPMGTPAYMAPEQALGMAIPESDQYALGTMAYEFFTGRRFVTDRIYLRFQDPKTFDAIVQIIGIQNELRPLMSAVGPAILKATAPDPEHRYPSTITFAEDVQTRLTDARRGKLFLSANPHQLDPQNDLFSAPTAKDITPEKPAGTTLIEYRGHSNRVLSVDWSPNGKYIVSGGYDSSIQVWDVDTGNLKVECKGNSYVSSWSPDGKYIASGGDVTDTVQVWDVDTGNLKVEYKGDSRLAWSPDGKYIASGGRYYDDTVQVWEADTGNLKVEYEGDSRLCPFSWSPDGKYIALAGDVADTVQVWDVDTGNRILDYKRHSDRVSSVAWSPDGKYIASGGDDKTVHVWVAPK